MAERYLTQMMKKAQRLELTDKLKAPRDILETNPQGHRKLLVLDQAGQSATDSAAQCCSPEHIAGGRERMSCVGKRQKPLDISCRHATSTATTRQSRVPGYPGSTLHYTLHPAFLASGLIIGTVGDMKTIFIEVDTIITTKERKTRMCRADRI